MANDKGEHTPKKPPPSATEGVICWAAAVGLVTSHMYRWFCSGEEPGADVKKTWERRGERMRQREKHNISPWSSPKTTTRW